MKNILILIACFCTTISQAQVLGNYNVERGNQRYELQRQAQIYAVSPQGGEVILNVKGLKNVIPDGYLAIFNLKERGKTAQETEGFINAKMAQFMTSCAALGLEEEDIYVDMLSMVPIFEYETFKKLLSKKYVEVPSGFEMQQNIHIHYTDAKLLVKIVSAAAEAGIYDMASVTPYINDVEGIYDELRTHALDVLRKKEKLYRDAGMALDTLFKNVGENTSVVYPDQSYSSYQPAVTVNRLDPDTKENRIETVRKPKTHFYEPMRITDFDFVLNPKVFEPSLQLSYHLQVRYRIEYPKPKEKPKVQVKIEKKKEYYILTPEGETKLIKLDQE